MPQVSAEILLILTIVLSVNLIIEDTSRLVINILKELLWLNLLGLWSPVETIQCMNWVLLLWVV